MRNLTGKLAVMLLMAGALAMPASAAPAAPERGGGGAPHIGGGGAPHFGGGGAPHFGGGGRAAFHAAPEISVALLVGRSSASRPAGTVEGAHRRAALLNLERRILRS